LYRSLCYKAEAFLCLYIFYAENMAIPVLSVTSAGPSCSSFSLFSFYILFLSDKHNSSFCFYAIHTHAYNPISFRIYNYYLLIAPHSGIRFF
ncbi:hypothetical protein, partial [Sphingobacterium anhuiense]